MDTWWKWALIALGTTVAGFGGLAVVSGGPWYSVAFGLTALAMGGVVIWRAAVMGVRLADDGITSTDLDRRITISWCEVDSIESDRRRNMVFFHTAAPTLHLTYRQVRLKELSRLSFKQTSPKTERHVDELRKALAEHRATCPTCRPAPVLTDERGPLRRLLTRWRRRLLPDPQR